MPYCAQDFWRWTDAIGDLLERRKIASDLKYLRGGLNARNCTHSYCGDRLIDGVLDIFNPGLCGLVKLSRAEGVCLNWQGLAQLFPKLVPVSFAVLPTSRNPYR